MAHHSPGRSGGCDSTQQPGNVGRHPLKAPPDRDLVVLVSARIWTYACICMYMLIYARMSGYMHVYARIRMYVHVWARMYAWESYTTKMPCYFTAADTAILAKWYGSPPIIWKEGVWDLTVSKVFCKVFSSFFVPCYRGQIPSCRRR